MHLNRQGFLDELLSVAPGLSPKEATEQSSCFVFRKGKVITFNDEVACRVKSSLQFDDPIAVVAAPLLTLLRKLSEDEIEVDLNGGELVVQGKGRKSGIRVEEKVTMPIEGIEQPGEWKPVPSRLRRAVEIVGQSAGSDPSFFALSCVHFTADYVEACDRFQAARFFLKTGVEGDLLVRQPAITPIVGVNPVEFCMTQNWVHFKNKAGLVFSCRQYEEKYPSIDKLFEVHGVPAAVPTGIDGAIDRAMIFIEGRDTGRVVVSLSPGKFSLTGRGEQGWYQESQEVDYKGKALKFSVAPRLLSEISQRSPTMEIAKGQLRVDVDTKADKEKGVKLEKWTWIACTGDVEK